MGQAVKERAAETLITKRRGPFIERQVRCDDRGDALTALADQLELQLGPDMRQRHEAQLENSAGIISHETAGIVRAGAA